jgi:hypothetical protein
MSAWDKHSAAASAAGFEQQRQLALVLLAEAYPSDPTVKVRLEAVEDIDLVSDTKKGRRFQVKHHLEDNLLTDKTPELWLTLAIWIDSVNGVPLEDWPHFYLATTATSKPDSAASHLGDSGRSLESALASLISAAEESTNTATDEARKKFLDLERHRQLALLEHVFVLDATPQVVDLDARLRRALLYALPGTQSDRFLEGIMGWWVSRSAGLLSGTIETVSGVQFHAFCVSLRDRFQSEGLVTHAELRTDPTDIEKVPYRDRRFVRQLELVEADANLVDLAIRHYHRAFAQRGRWARELDDLSDDIDAFEDRLSDEWEFAHTAMCSRVSSQAKERTQAGLRFFTEFPPSATARLRGLDEPVLCFGTLHGLADDVRVGWHPDYESFFSSAEEAA